MSGAAYLLRGDARRIPLADDSVDLIVTSPPYLWKRKYAIDGAGEMGNERDWRAYLAGLYAVTDELVRVLKPTGSAFVNLGDTRVTGTEPKWLGVPVKSRLLLPERYRVGCQDRYLSQGVIVRQVQIWEKANGLPESCEDRTRDSHEDFVHLVKQPKYYAGVDEVRAAHSEWTQKAAEGRWVRRSQVRAEAGSGASGTTSRVGTNRADGINPLGKLPGSVWSVEESLWDGPINFCPRCGRNLTDAGNGSAGRTLTVTASSGLPTSGRSEPTDSPTSSTSDPSLTDSPSTTSAETEDASDPTTSSPSPVSRTAPEETPQPPGTQSRPVATTATSSPRLTRISERTVSASVGCVCEIGLEPSVPGSVWSVPSEPLRVPAHLGIDHYAAFPSEWPRRLILGWSPPAICCECGQARAPVVDKRYELDHMQRNLTPALRDGAEPNGNRRGMNAEYRETSRTQATILGYACPCCPHTDHPGTGGERGPEYDHADFGGYPKVAPSGGAKGRTALQDRPKVGPWREWHLDGWRPPPSRPSVVLDPFVGTGTTPMVARALGRVGIGLDLSADYLRLATWRIWSSGDAAKSISRTNLEHQGSLL